MRPVCSNLPNLFIRCVVVLAGCWAQAAVVEAQTPAAPPTDKWTKMVDLTNRYRFVERYPREDGRELPGSLGPYRVGMIEVIKEVIDQPQGAPRRAESTRQSVFVERATEQAGVGGVIGSVRFMERYGLEPADPTRTMSPQPLNGLGLSLRYRSTDWPIMTPTSDRKPTDYEFEVVTRQMVVPLLTQVLPQQPVHIGDTWEVARKGAVALIGDPLAQREALTGKFIELRKEVDGPRSAATLGVTGRVTTPIGDAAINAEVVFTFQPVTTAKSPPGAPATKTPEGLVEARGAITEVRMARTTTGDLPGPGRLHFQTTREVTMERQIDIGDKAVTLPKLPFNPKVEQPANWLTLVDAGKRFQLEHPQDLLPPERPALAPVALNTATLVRNRREGTDLIQIDFVGKNLTPDDIKAKLKAKTDQMKIPVTKGEEGWLPEADWKNGKVYRIEAIVNVPEQGGSTRGRSGTTRIHFDAFLIQSAQAAGILAIATTSREVVASYRREVEEILKTIQIDPALPAVPR